MASQSSEHTDTPEPAKDMIASIRKHAPIFKNLRPGLKPNTLWVVVEWSGFGQDKLAKEITNRGFPRMIGCTTSWETAEFVTSKTVLGLLNIPYGMRCTANFPYS
jgi:hypothetical protein